MAKRRNQYTFPDQRPAQIDSVDRPRFRLDQDEIEQLLMGESLYGDPGRHRRIQSPCGACIRELLQEALELRELRLKMKQKGEARLFVSDFVFVISDWLRWRTGEQTGQQSLPATPGGVGMTEEVIKNYSTQIGKSCYRSPEFNKERDAMKAARKVVSPISIFGMIPRLGKPRTESPFVAMEKQ
jgi:hypothetical protein